MNKLKMAVVLWFLCATTFCFAQQEAVFINIRFYDKKIYFAESDTILVQLTVVNNSPDVYRFRLADNRAFSVEFETLTRANRMLDRGDVVERRRTTSAQVFYRDVSIDPGESFSFVENLRDYSKIEGAGNFVVQARLYPELLDMPNRQTASFNGAMPSTILPLLSNRLALQIKPRAILNADGVAIALDIETGAVLARDKLSPDQIITWTLRARQKSEWEKFFLYLDIEKMIARDGARQRRWRAESEEGRLRMIANYRSELQKTNIDGDIAAIPMSFDIERTTYGASSGTVIVLEKFKIGDYVERKRYTYYLEKEDEYWTIIDYTVMNLGTE